MLCMAELFFYFYFVCLCHVSLFKISKEKIESINFIFGGDLPSDTRKKPFDFEKNRPRVRVGLKVVVVGRNKILAQG